MINYLVTLPTLVAEHTTWVLVPLCAHQLGGREQLTPTHDRYTISGWTEMP